MKRNSTSLTITFTASAALSPALASVVTDALPLRLTQAEMVQDFQLLDPSTYATTPEIAEQLARIRRVVEADGQRIALARWKDGTECLVGFDKRQPYPNPDQLIRAYKSACNARLWNLKDGDDAEMAHD